MLVKMRHLCSDTSGNPAVEFAFIAPIVLLFIGGLLELGYVSFARSTLESSILTASRMSRAADCPAQQSAQLQEELNKRMDNVISADGNDPVLIVSSYGQAFGNVDSPEPFNDIDGNGQFDPGEPYTDVNANSEWDEDMGKSNDYGAYGEVVEFLATYNVRSLFPFVAEKINGGNGFYTITAKTVIRNEPYRDVTC